MRVRRATAADCAPVWAVRARAIRHAAPAHYPPPAVDAWCARRTPADYAEALLASTLVVAEDDDGRVVGFAQLDPAEGVVESVYVDPDFARRGIGRRLVEALEHEARSAGTKRLVLSATRNAVGFYEARGYRREGPVRLALGHGQSIDCELMSKTLDAVEDAAAPLAP